MKKFLLSSVVAFLVLIATAPPRVAADSFAINTFGGIVTDDDALTLKKNTPDSQNIVSDLGPGIQGRKGFVDFSTETASAQWELPHSSGARYLIKWSSVDNTIKASLGSGTFTILVSTVASGVSTVGAILGDAFYFANTTDGLKKITFSGSAATLAARISTMTFTQIASWKGRLWGIGVSGNERTLYGSELYVGTNWTLPTGESPSNTLPTQLTISGAFDEPTTALYPTPFDTLAWMKAHSFGAIYGSNRDNFSQKVLSETVGTSYPETIQECDGYVRFLGPNRTVWEYKGGLLRPEDRISKGIDALMATFSQGDAASRQYQWTTQADFAAGNLGAGLTAAETPGSLKLSSGTLIDNFSDGDYTSSPAWTTFGVSGATANITSGQLKLTQSSAGSIGTVGLYTPWTFSSAVGVKVSLAQLDEGDFSLTENAVLISFLTSTPTGIRTPLPNGTSAYSLLVERSGSLGTRIEIDRSGFQFGSTVVIASSVYDAGGGIPSTIELWRSTAGYVAALINGNVVLSGTDTTLTSFADISVIGYFGAGVTTPSNAIVDDFYVKYTTGSWVSDSVQTAGMTAHDAFGVDGSLDGGTITFGLYTDSDSAKTVTNGVPVVGTYTSSQTITDASLPILSTAPYVFVSANFAITDPTQEPQLDNATVKWKTGSTIRAASAYFNQRYWLSLAANSTTNNRILVFDRNREWQLYSGINADSMRVYNGSLLFSNSTGMYQGETGYNDDGAAIAAYYTTPMFAPASLDIFTALDMLYMTTINSASTLATTYQVNGIATDHSMGSWAMNTNSGYQNFKLPFSFEDVQKTKYVSFKWSVTGSAAWKILNSNVYHTPDRIPE